MTHYKTFTIIKTLFGHEASNGKRTIIASGPLYRIEELIDKL